MISLGVCEGVLPMVHGVYALVGFPNTTPARRSRPALRTDSVTEALSLCSRSAAEASACLRQRPRAGASAMTRRAPGLWMDFMNTRDLWKAVLSRPHARRCRDADRWLSGWAGSSEPGERRGGAALTVEQARAASLSPSSVPHPQSAAEAAQVRTRACVAGPFTTWGGETHPRRVTQRDS